jgi:low temperature requirement protein LtrA
MTTGRLGVLLRRHEQGRAAFLELFFDLVFVLAFFQLSQKLLQQLNWASALQMSVLLLAVFAVWVSTATLSIRWSSWRSCRSCSGPS